MTPAEPLAFRLAALLSPTPAALKDLTHDLGCGWSDLRAAVNYLRTWCGLRIRYSDQGLWVARDDFPALYRLAWANDKE